MGCSNSKVDCAATELIAPNPDIAGVGVTASFILNMAFTIILCIASFILREHPFDTIDLLDRHVYFKRGQSFEP